MKNLSPYEAAWFARRHAAHLGFVSAAYSNEVWERGKLAALTAAVRAEELWNAGKLDGGRHQDCVELYEYMAGEKFEKRKAITVVQPLVLSPITPEDDE